VLKEYILMTPNCSTFFDVKFEKKNLGRNLEIAKGISNKWITVPNSMITIQYINLGEK